MLCKTEGCGEAPIFFDPKETKLGEQINPDQNLDTNTFTFQ